MRALLLVLVIACGGEPAVERFEVAQFPAVAVSQLDLLVLVDNSGSTAHWQVALGTAAPKLFAGLTIDGVLPDLHIGVVSSDMGTTGSLDLDKPAAPVGTVGQGGCAGDGDGGFMRTFLTDVADTTVATGARIRNYEGTLASAFKTAVQLGSTGCGFEQHLQAIRRARRVNTDFWRTDASRAVVVLADEDDCSVRDAHIFEDDPALGPLSSFRCTQFGLICDQRLDAVGEKTNCRADATSMLVEDPALTKADLEFGINGPERSTFSAIVGTPTIAIEERVISSASSLALTHSCTLQSPQGAQAADPGLRLTHLADSYASRGGAYSICDASYDAAVTQIARTIKRSLGVACLDASVAVDDCQVFDVRERARIEIPRCPAAGDCFDIVPDAACGGSRVTIDRTTTPAPTTRVEVLCAAP